MKLRAPKSLRELPALQRWALGLALLTVVWFALIQGKPSFTNASRPQRISNPHLAIQFVRSVQEIDDLLGDVYESRPSPDRLVMRFKQYLDFGFIASYCALFAVMGALAYRDGGFARPLAIGGAICGIAAGVFDVVEDVGILRLMDVPLLHTTPAMLNAIRQPAAAKWSLAAASFLLFALWLVRKTGWPRIASAPLFLAAAGIVAMIAICS